MLALAVLGVLISRTDGTITLEANAQRLDKILPEISKLVGKPIACDAVLADQNVLIGVHDVPVDAFMAHLAQAMTARWETSASGSLSLRLDREAVQRHKQAELQKSTDRIKAGQAELVKQANQMKPFTPDAARALQQMWAGVDEGYESPDQQAQQRSFALMEQAEKQMPAQRVTDLVIASLNPSDIAQLPVGQTMFSNLPTKMEYNLPKIDQSLFNDLAKSQDVWIKSYVQDPNYSERRSRFTIDPRAYTKPFDPSNMRLVLIAQKDYAGGDPHFTAWYLGKDGSMVMFGESSLPDPPAKQAATPDAKPQQEELVPLRPESAAYLSAFFPPRGQSQTVTDAVHRQTADPLNNEPLSFFVSDALLGAAKNDRLNIVACLSDDAIEMGWIVNNEKTRVASQIWGSASWNAMDVERKDGWATVSLRDWKEPLNRKRLADYLKTVDSEGMIGLDEAAAYQASVGFDDAPALLQQSVSALFPSSSGLPQPWSTELRFYGLLSPQERGTLKARQQLSFGNLNSSAKSLLQVLAYQKHRSFMARPSAESFQRGVRIGPMSQYMPEALPDGIDPRGFFTMFETKNPGVLVKYDGAGYSGATSMEIRSLAMHQLAASMPQLRDYDQLRNGIPSGYLVGSHVLLTFQFKLSPNIDANMSLDGSEYNLRGQFVSFDNLPADFRASLDKEVESVRKQFSQQQNPTRLGGTPPPR